MSTQSTFVIILLLAGLGFGGCEKKAETASRPPDVAVIQVAQQDVPITREWVATLDGFVNAQIRAQVSGLLLNQKYVNGEYVRKGDPLFEIDPRPFQAELNQTTGNLAQAQANLQRAQARLGKTELDVARYTPLAKESAISQQELDDAVQANLAAKAEVEQAKAAIDTAQAAVETARLNLGFTSITSPLNGVSAIATAQVGDFVGPQSGPLTTISTVDPILANFTASEQEYLNAIRQATISGKSQEAILQTLEWQLLLADGTSFPQKGRFYALDRGVDVRTGSILLQVQFPNRGNVLRPGGFGSIRTVVKIQHGALLVPQRAVTELQGGYLVAVIDSQNKVSIRRIKVGSRVGNMWIVDDGLKPDERIVAEGVQKIREGMQVTPQPYTGSPETAQSSTDGNKAP